jgi:hypothetical protein
MGRPQIGGPSKQELLQSVPLRRWYENVGRGSVITADVKLRSLRLFCHLTETDPFKLLKMNEKRMHDLLLDFIAAEEKRGQSGSSTHTHVKAVKSWLAFNGIVVNRPVKIRNTQATPTLKDERVPTQEELRRIFMASTPRNRMMCALMAHSGVRPEVLGNYLGKDGLRVGDLPDLRIKGGTVEFNQIPAQVVVRPELSKAGHKYFTFIGGEACSYVVDYLRQRMEAGEQIGPDSDLIHAQANQDKIRGSDKHLTTVNVGDGVRKSIRAAGLPWRPYVLRAYFDTQLLLAENKGKVAHDYRVFWMGHKGSIEARYTTNKARLPGDFIEDMRDTYKRCLPFLETISGHHDDVPKEVARAMLQLAGFDEEEIEKMDLNDLAAVRDQVRERLGASDGPRQEVVAIGEVPQRLAAGWQFVAALGTTQAIVTSPSSPRTSPTPGASALPLRVTTNPVPLAGQSATGGSRGGAPPTSSAAAGPSLPSHLPPRASGRPGEAHSVGAHRMEPHRGSPEKDSPLQS